MRKLNTKRTINDSIKPGEKLSQRVIRSGVWVFSLRVVQQLFNLARLVIIARILTPHDFGLFGIALLIMATLDTFSQTGFRQALIQKKGDIKPYLDSAWTVLILRGFVLFAILYFIAPHVAMFFEAPEAKPIIQVIGFSILLQAFTNIGVIYFQKELEFNKQFVYQLTGTLADFIVAVSAVLILKNVWALVFGLLAGNAARCFVSYIIHPYRPHLSLNWNKTKELWSYGKWILGSTILVFLITQGDDILVGKLLGITALGFYQMAYRISNTPTTEITHVISRVMFPAYSKLQDNLPKLREAYLKVLQLTTYLSFLITGLIFALASDFTIIFLGEKWMPMIPAVQILVFAGLVRSIAATAGPVFRAVGKPKIDTKWQIVRLIVMVALIYPFAMKWGITGVSTVVFLSIFVSNIGFSFMAIRITKCEVEKFIKVIILPLINGIVVVLFILGLKTVIGIGIWEFVTLSCVGVLTYLSITYLLDKFFNYKMQLLIRQSLQTIKTY